MEKTSNQPLLDCAAVRALLDGGDMENHKEALRHHLTQCADCRAEARIRVLMREMAAEPPAELTDSIMAQIRAERTKTTLRLRRIRRWGSVAAAAVLVPAVVILAPILLRTGEDVTTDSEAERVSVTRDAVPEENGTVPELATVFTYTSSGAEESVQSSAGAEAETGNASGDIPDKLMYAAVTAGSTEAAKADGAENAGPETSPGIAAFGTETSGETAAAPETTGAATGVVGAAPEYVGSRDPAAPERPAGLSTMAASEAAAPQSEAPFYTVIRALVGDAALQAHLAAYDGEDNDLPAWLCEKCGITREAFTTQAAALDLPFSEAELAAIFG